MKKNWKLNRGSQLTNQETNTTEEDNEIIKEKLLLNLYEEFVNFNQEINIKRVVDLEFSKIQYSCDTEIKQYFTWKK